MSKRILVTGGCGFIGHHFIDHLIVNTDWLVIILDKLTYASAGFDRLRDSKLFDEKRILILSADFTNPISIGLAKEINHVDYVVHMGAETHVDRSIVDPAPFVYSNVVGTMNMLEWARKTPSIEKFIYLSTDEVFGPADKGQNFSEWDRYNSGNPYAASKAGGEELCLAWANTYGLPITIVHTQNVFAQRQHPEKFIPMTIRKVLAGDTVLVHSDQFGMSGSRFWIHARNLADGLLYLLKDDVSFLFREKFNIVGEREISNFEMAELISKIIDKPLKYDLVLPDRPGHDRRYALSGVKMENLGWHHPVSFEESLKKTVFWSLENQWWLTPSFYEDVNAKVI